MRPSSAGRFGIGACGFAGVAGRSWEYALTWKLGFRGSSAGQSSPTAGTLAALLAPHGARLGVVKREDHDLARA
jgi:hypothetical protein